MYCTKKVLISLVIFSSFNLSFSQKIEVTTAPGIDLSRNDINEVVNLWKLYLNKNPESNIQNIYWNDFEKTKYNSCDLLRTEGFFNPSLYALGFKNKILFVKNEDNKYLINSMYYYIDENNEFIPFATTNVYAIKENNEYKLYNYLPIATKNWKERKVGNIIYYFPEEYNFNNDMAVRANNYVEKIIQLFDIEHLNTITYYIAPNCEEIYNIKGFDFIVGRGNKTNLCGFFDNQNYIVYSNYNAGEFYRHELLHIINNRFADTHEILLSGISVYTNAKNTFLGKPFSFHIKNICENFLDKDKKNDILNFDTLPSLNSETEVFYFVGAVLIEITLEKGGEKLMLKLFKDCKNFDDILFFFQNEFGYNKEELNKKVKERFYKISNDKDYKFLLQLD